MVNNAFHSAHEQDFKTCMVLFMLFCELNRIHSSTTAIWKRVTQGRVNSFCVWIKGVDTTCLISEKKAKLEQ